LRQLLDGLFDVLSQELVEELLLRIAPPQEKWLMHSLEQGEVLFAVQFGSDLPRSRLLFAPLAHEPVDEDPENPFLESLPVLQIREPGPGLGKRVRDQVLGKIGRASCRERG